MQTFIGILLGGGFLAFLQFLISRYDKKHDKLSDLEKDLKSIKDALIKMDEKCDEREAINSRVRILRFGDELMYQPEKRHSKDSFDQVLSDIDAYEHYCNSHRDFKNNQTVVTTEYIRKVYNERLEKKDFA